MFRSLARQALRLRVFLLAAALAAGTVRAAEPLGSVPGTVIAVSSNSTTVFLGSPSLAILPGGAYAASYDVGGKNPRAGHTAICASSDRGNTWTQLAELTAQHWSTLFTHDNALWLIGVSTKGGHIQIHRSTDGGRTWTTPADEKSGVLATDGKFHCGPTPVVVNGGRVWRAFEQFAPTGNARIFSAFMLSAPADADLLDAASWTRSRAIACQREWLNVLTPSWLEGNAVVTPSGALVDVLRVESHPAAGVNWELPGAARSIPRFEVAAMLEISADGRDARFDPARGSASNISIGSSKAMISSRYPARPGTASTITTPTTSPFTASSISAASPWLTRRRTSLVVLPNKLWRTS